MYMLVLIYIIFSFFNILENSEISTLQAVSYCFLIMIPLCLLIYSVWQRNVRLETSSYVGTAICTPFILASALIGLGLMFGIAYGIIGALVGAVIAYFGFNPLFNMRTPETRILADVSADEAAKITKRHHYEIVKKFRIFPMGDNESNIIHGSEQAHIVMTRDLSLINQLKKKGNLAELLSEGPKEIPAFLKDPDRRWCGIGIDPIAIAVNPLSWKKRLENDPEPVRSLETLLSPNLSGSFVLPDPEKSPAGRLFLSGLAQHMGMEEGVAFMRDLKKQASGLYSDKLDLKQCFSSPSMLAAVGQLHGFLDSGAAKLKLLLSSPDGAAWDLMMAGILRESPDPVQAEDFLEYITSKPGNERFNYKLNFMSSHPRALVPHGSPTLEQSGINREYDHAKAEADWPALLEMWKREA
jgi:ABC-type Fe3+ transport system, periplasmic component